MTFVHEVPLLPLKVFQQRIPEAKRWNQRYFRRKNLLTPLVSVSQVQNHEKESTRLQGTVPSIMVNGCRGKMGKAVINAAICAGLHLIPASFGSVTDYGKSVNVCEKEIQLHGPSERESILASLIKQYPNLIAVDCTVPAAVHGIYNTDLYAKVGVPFVLGSASGNLEKLRRTVQESNTYAVISPYMGKQVVAFRVAMEIMAERFPSAFSGYSLEVTESQQESKIGTSGTAKAVISCFKKLGVSFELGQVKEIRDPQEQFEMVGVPVEHLPSHAFNLYHLTSPDESVTFEIQHNVCGTASHAEGAIDAALFLYSKVREKADERIYNMVDVLRAGNLR